MNKYLENQVRESLGVVLAHKDKGRIKQILADLTTPEERETISKRLAIAIFLDKGRSYEDIKANLQIPVNQVAWVAKHMGNPGFQQAMLEIKAERWADHWTSQIMRLINKWRS